MTAAGRVTLVREYLRCPACGDPCHTLDDLLGLAGLLSPRAEVPRTRPLVAGDLLATVYHVLGIDLKLHFTSGGRPVPILPDGKPIAELV